MQSPKCQIKRKHFYSFSCFLVFKIIHCVIMKRAPNDAARMDPDADGQHLGCSASLTRNLFEILCKRAPSKIMTAEL